MGFSVPFAITPMPPKSIYDEPANLFLPSTSNPGPDDIAAEEERKRKEREQKAQADLAKKTLTNKAKGLDPTGRPLKAKDKPQPQTPQPRKLLTDKNRFKPAIPGVVDLFRMVTKNGDKEGLWAVAKEPLRILDKGFTGVVEGTAEFALWGASTAYSVAQRNLNKVAGTQLPALPKTWDPLEKEYRETLINSMSDANKPATQVGQAAADILTFALTTFSVAKQLPQLGVRGLVAKTANKGLAARTAAQAATGIPAGAVADFMLTKAGDPNLANVVRDLPFVSPETEDLWSLGLASSRTDNAFISKIKATITGGAVGAGADAVGYLLAARKATQAFLKQGLPAEEALARGVAVGALESSEARAARIALADSQKPVAETGRIRELETRRIELEAELADLDAKALGKAPTAKAAADAAAPATVTPEAPKVPSASAAVPPAAPSAPAKPSSRFPASADRKLSPGSVEGAAQVLMKWANAGFAQDKWPVKSIDEARTLVQAKNRQLWAENIPGIDLDRANNDLVMGRESPAVQDVRSAYREFYGLEPGASQAAPTTPLEAPAAGQADTAATQASPEIQEAEQRLQEASPTATPADNEATVAAAEVDRLATEKVTKDLEDAMAPKTEEADPITKRMEEINRQLADIYDEKAQIEMDMGTPKENLRAEDQAAFDDSTPPSAAAADQIRTETIIPKVARRTDVPPEILKDATSPTAGKSPSVFTDAFYKIISTAPDVTKATIQVIRRTASDMDLREISKAAGRPINEVVADAARFIDTFRQANAAAGDDVAGGADLRELLQTQKLTKTVIEDGNSKELLNAQGIVAAKVIITDTANQIYILAKSLDDLYTAGRNPGNQMDRLVDRLVVISELHKITLGEAGYSLRMGQEMLEGQAGRAAPIMSPSAVKAQRTKFLKDWATDVKKLSRAGQDAAAQEKLQALVKMLVLNQGDPAGTIRQFTLITRVGAQLAMNGMYHSILSGPISQLRNIAGNTYSTIEKPLSLGITGVFTRNPAARYAAVAAYRGVSESLSDAFKVMRVSFQTGEPLQINRRFVLQEAEAAANLDAIRLSTEPIKDGMEPAAYARAVAENAALGIVDTLYRVQNNQLFNWGSRALVAGDDFFKIINSRMKVAMDSAYLAHSSNLSPKELDARYAEIYAQKFASSFHADLQIKDEALLDWADAGTFQDNPGGLVNGLTNLLEQEPILRLAMPFVRTPYNLMVYSAQHFPLLNLASSRAKKVLQSMPGDEGYDPVAKAIMQGRQTIGATVFGAIAMGALQGNIRGNGPPPGPVRELWLQEGPARSIKVGGVWVSYEAIEPINNFMAIGADVAMLARMGHVEAAERLGEQLLFAFAISVVDKSYLSGVTVVSSYLDPKTYHSPDKLTRGVLSTANNFLPMAGARRSMSNVLNPYLREIDGALNKTLAVALPGYALAFPTKIDPFTNKPFTSLSGGWYNANSPFRIYDKDFPEGTEEALGQSVALSLSEANWDSSTLTTKFDQGEEIDAVERADFAKALYVVKLAPRLQALFDSPSYKQALSAYKNRSTGIKAEESAHIVAINSLINQVKKEARAVMLNSSEKWRTRNDLVQQRRYQGGRGDIEAAIKTKKAIEELTDGN